MSTGIKLFNKALRFYKNENLKAAIHHFELASNYNQADALLYLGQIYEQGKHVNTNKTKAFEYYERAANGDQAKAQYHVGTFYYTENDIVKQDLSLAQYWFKRAVENGNADAENSLGELYYRSEDYKKAFYWFLKAAENSNVNAQFFLGQLYEKGLESMAEQDCEVAIFWYKKAAKKKHAAASYNIGSVYASGCGNVKQDYTLALKWYKQASLRNISDAQLDIGIMYSQGYGVPMNKTEAAYWYQKASENGNMEARRQINCLPKEEALTETEQEPLSLILSELSDIQQASADQACGYKPFVLNSISNSGFNSYSWSSIIIVIAFLLFFCYRCLSRRK